MKKILLGAIAFFLFSISVSILQTSCDKDAEAAPETNTNVTQLGKLFYFRSQTINSPDEMYTANYDGTGQTKLNIIMPSGWEIDKNYGLSISPDGKKLFFVGDAGQSNYIFSCNIDGSNVTKLSIDLGPNGDTGHLGGAY